jgi:hypothetical protein|tara:strand:- start:2083 stop:2730 length:648 start_codon:yes stop_codon:yes gene_type:complete
MSNTINSGTASALNANETLLARAITSSGDKIGFEFHEVISNGDAGMPGINLTHLANKSDTRFGIRSQKAWLYGEEADMLEMFGLPAGSLDGLWQVDQEYLDRTGTSRNQAVLNISNPTLTGHASPDGEAIRTRVQITETLVPNDYQAEDLESRCKRKGPDGDKILHQGNMIFRNANIVASVGSVAAVNIFLAADKVPVTAQNAVNAFSDVEGLAI